MALDSYDALKTSIALWAFRSQDEEFEATVPDFIRLLETRVNRELRTTFQETSAPIALTNSVGDLPTDYLAFRNFSTIGAFPHVLVSSASAGWGDQFAIEGLKVRLGGLTPSAGVTLDYYARIPPLSDANQTNWLLQRAPDIYLYGSLLEACIFMQDADPSSLAKWTALYQKAVADLQSLDHMARYSRASVRASGPTP
ncbi:phage adaptor protein [Aureimonas pseudogalii]|uniref:Uncharacterized protein n=1 Tax=Aureimonas pseudogalii TaxID=1744844 RepID=A0A7W6EDB9_9HYPH|nr:hypothetical protein [Aureimonas pseudogalii]MBB3997197.1 hypothetical protein [Aureimonas pseudogalii]